MRRAELFILCVVTLLIYSNSLSFPFHFDDADNILDNPAIRSLSNVLDFSGTRTIGFLGFALNFHFGGLNVFGYHLVNILIHITNGLLVYSLVSLLIKAVPGDRFPVPWVAFAASLLFVVHPVQTQAVTYIVQRFASLMTLFYLLAVVGYLKWRLTVPDARGRYLWYGAALLSTLLAMKTKENSFTLPFMILLVEVIFFRAFSKKRWLTLLPFLLTLLTIPLSHVDALGEAEGFARDTAEIGRFDYLFTQFRVIVTYLRLLVLPINQNLDYDYPIYHSLFHPAVFLSFLFLLCLAGFALFGLFHSRPSSGNPQRKLISFGILWFFLTLSVESSIIPIKDVIFEHRLYLPSVGFFLGIGLLASCGWERRKKMRAPLAVIGLLILGTLSMATCQRNFVWADDVILWRDVIQKAPGKARAHGNLGSALEAEGRTEEAIREYQTALKFQPDYYQALNNLGSALVTQGRQDEAIEAFQKTLSLKPDLPTTLYNLGVAYAKQGRLEEAIREYRNALKLKPDYVKARTNLGTLYATQGRLQEATQEYETALKLKADSAEVHNNLGNVYLLQGRVEEAIKQYHETLKLKPDFAEARNNLDNAYKRK